MTFYFQIPRTSQKRTELLRGTYHFYKPDLSNCIKYVEDVCSKVLYRDDCLVSSVVAFKRYDTNPRTEFTVRVLRGK